MGLTVVDAGVVIGILDESDRHHGAATIAVGDARNAGDRLVLPASAYAEALVGPIRSGVDDAIGRFDKFLDSIPIEVVPLGRRMAAVAARLRATEAPKVRLPDAAVIATAVDLGADRILTTDARWPQVDVPVQVIAEHKS
jgi:predicted nucleic acid-binding protein